MKNCIFASSFKFQSWSQTPQSAHHPHKRNDEHCHCNPGVVYILLFSSVLTICAPPPWKSLFWSQVLCGGSLQVLSSGRAGGISFSSKMESNIMNFDRRSGIPFVKKRLLQKSEGIFFPNEAACFFCGGFLVDFFSFLLFFLGKKGGKIHHKKNPRQISNRDLGVSRPKPTLQGSGLDIPFVRNPNS